MKTVAIIGAGPGGLATAKILLRSETSKFKVRIFDKKSQVGGLWAVDKEAPYDGMLNPEMPTNISRFNIAFSDLSWQSVGLPGHVPYFPKAWQAGRYLQAYAKKFIPEESLMLNCRVVSVDKVESSSHPTKWRVIWEQADAGGEPRQLEDVVDFLVIASGFFPKPFIPPSYPVTGTEHAIKQKHSTEIRHISDVVTSEPATEGFDRTILIVGAGMSGADVAATLAAQLSNSRSEPGNSESAYNGIRLVQIVPGPSYALPLMVPMNAADPEMEAPDFMPLDLAMYDLGKRPPGKIELGVGKLNQDFMAKSHAFLSGIVGGDQTEIGRPGIAYANTAGLSTSVTIAEKYAEFLRSGDIETISGRFEALQHVPGGCKAKVIRDATTTTVVNIVGVIHATGFSPLPSLGFLGADLLEELEYDSKNERLPLILDMDQFYTGKGSKTPNLAFVGFHEGQSWPGMEMQARFIEKSWRQDSPKAAVSTNSKEASRELLRGLRASMAAREPEVPMYWLGDYVGLMSNLASSVGIARNDLDWPERSGPIAAARYADQQSDRSEVNRTLEELDTILRESKHGAKFVARAAFRAMQGAWKIYRKLNSFLPDFPSGSLEGTAEFHPRCPTDPAYDVEYLYIEQGIFQNEQGLSFSASRRYVYRYQESVDKITAWFIKDDGKTVDYLFHDLKFDPSSRQHGWIAKTDHLCVKDMYESTYCFRFKGANIKTFDITHAVKGPHKDYVSNTSYVRSR